MGQSPLTPLAPTGLDDGPHRLAQSGGSPPSSVSRGWLDLRVTVDDRAVPLRLVRNRRARRYVLRVLADGSVRVTVPRGGDAPAAAAFARRHLSWIATRLRKLATEPKPSHHWPPGTQLLLRGEWVTLTVESDTGGSRVRFGPEAIPVPSVPANLRPAVEQHLWRLAVRELPARVRELAGLHQLPLRRLMIRNQRSRWGSCSARGTVSLNWRLIQVPDWVRDYVILHELMHLRQMNHSSLFWSLVRAACPPCAEARLWLRRHPLGGGARSR